MMNEFDFVEFGGKMLNFLDLAACFIILTVQSINPASDRNHWVLSNFGSWDQVSVMPTFREIVLVVSIRVIANLLTLNIG